MRAVPIVQRVAAYAVIIRDGRILLSRLSESVTPEELWTLPGGGIDHGEHPRDAVVREVHEETGLAVVVGETARVYSLHLPTAWRDGRRVDAHSLRIVYDGTVPVDAPEPRVVEVDGSTAEAAWVSLRDVLEGTIPVATLVQEALADHQPVQMQRVAAYLLAIRDDSVLLTRISPRGFHTGSWTLPGGGVDHGERPRDTLIREVREECGVYCTVGDLLAVDDVHFAGTAPSGRHEDFHAIHLVFTGSVPDDAEPRVQEVDGTTDAVAWVPLSAVEDGTLPVLDVVRVALAAASPAAAEGAADG
jgi:ADP-ribose pyrophosphatase YjhB (NUDIX family)